MKSIFFYDSNYHFKNSLFLEKLTRFLQKQNQYSFVGNIDKADIVFSASKYLPIEKYPTKHFIFGPHFAVFPQDKPELQYFNNIHRNAIYIQPSEWCVQVWKDLKFTQLPLVAMPFGVDTEKFKPNVNTNTGNYVLVYFKRRKREELVYVVNYLQQLEYQVILLDTNKGYKEEDYIETLKLVRFIVWIGTHESQGFALEEALSMNIPILVWNVTKMNQEITQEEAYKKIETRATTIPYWDNRCGEYFHNKSEFISTVERFLFKLDTYKPRQYVLDNINTEKCIEKWTKLLQQF